VNHELPEGFTVKVSHYRYVTVFNESFTPELMSGLEWRGNYQPHSKGGKTIANVYDPDGNRIGTGVAYCNHRDNFNYKIGREIAVGRAMFAAGLLRRKRDIESVDREIAEAISNKFEEVVKA
jgi:hypothetical protein